MEICIHTKQSIFKSTTIGLAIMCFLSFVLFSYLNKKYVFENLLVCLSMGAYLFIFNVFVPIFIDRSISYHIVMLVNSNNTVTLSDFEKSNYTNDMYQQRFVELDKLGLIKNNDKTEPTKFGMIFTSIMKTFEKIFKIKSSYFEQLKNYKNGDNS